MTAAFRAFLLVALSLTRTLAAQEVAPKPEPLKYDLQYKFKTGEEIRYDVVDLVSIETTIAGNSQTAQAVSKSVKLWRVSDGKAGSEITFEHSVESVDMRNLMSGRQEVRYNSQTDKEAPPGYEDAAKAVGVTLATVTIDPRGAVLKRIEQKTGNAGTGGQIVVPLPTQAIPIGHVWTVPHEITVALDGDAVKKVKARQRFSLDGVTPDGMAQISVEMQILTPISDPKVQAQLIQRLTKGTITFDLKAGRIVSHELSLDERVLAFHGPDSSMHYQRKFTEKLVPAAEKVARKPEVKKEEPKKDL